MIARLPGRAIALALVLVAGLPGPAAAAPAPAGPVAVLYSRETPAMRAALPAAACDFYALEGFAKPRRPARTVVLAGHSLPPFYLGRPASEVAAAIGAFAPELVVLDTCYGASTPILEALAARGLRAWVVAPPFRIPQDGFVYGPAFLGAGRPEARALAVRTEPAFPLLRWRLDRGALGKLHGEVAALDAAALRRRLRRSRPPLVKMALPATLEPAAEVLVPVPAARFAVPARKRE